MTELLRKVISHVERLPPEQQDQLAAAFWEAIEEREWDALIATPGSQRFLEHMALEAIHEDKAGRTLSSGDRW